MKKITTMLLVLLLISGVSYGAVSDDVYVRRDVYEAHMQGMNAKLDMILEQQKELREEMKESREEHKAIRNEIAELTRVVSVQSARMDGVDARMGDMRSGIEGRIGDLQNTVEGRIGDLQNTVEGRVGDLRNDIYLGLVILGIVVGLPAVQKALEKREERKAARRASQMPFTLDDVRRLIEENNVKVLGKPQV